MTPSQEKWLMVVAPVLLAVVAGGALVGVIRVRATDTGGAGAGVNENAKAMPVQVMVLGELPPPTISDTYRGVVVASKESELAFRRGGRVQEIEVKEGTIVRQGDRLATLNTADVEAAMDAARSQIAEANALLQELIAGPRKQTIEAAQAEVRRLESAVELAAATAKRLQSLVDVNAASYQQWDDANSALQQQTAELAASRERLSELHEGTRAEQVTAQRSRVNRLEAELRSLEVNLADSRIVAPFDGVIARRYLDEGAIVGPDTRALRLLQVDPLEARFGVSPSDAASLHPGQAVVLTSGQEKFVASVARIEPEVDLVTRTQGLFVTIGSAPLPDDQSPASPARLIPGQTVSLALASAEPANLGTRSQRGTAATAGKAESASGLAGQLWVPLGALSRADRGLWSLYVVVQTEAGDFEIERREAQVLAVDAELAQVGGALIRAGDRVVSGALHRVTPGMKVEPIR